MPPKKDYEETVKSRLDDVAPRPRISFSDLEKSMTLFTGDDTYPIETWITDFEDTATLMEWTNLEKLIYAKRLLSGTAKLFLRSTGSLSSWNTLRESLKEEFGPKLSSATIHKKLASRKMKPDESYQQYFLHMKELAMHGNLEDEALIEYVIDGIRDSEMNKGILYGATDVKQFRKKLEVYSQIKDKIPEKSFAQMNKTMERKNLHTRRCYNCGDTDHQSSVCTKGIKCFKCNDYGHKSFECQSNTKKTLKIQDDNISTDFPKPYKEAKINGIEVKTFIDTGSDANLISECYFMKTFSQTNDYNPETKLNLSGIAEHEIRTKGFFLANVEIDDVLFETTIHIVDDNVITVDVILGNPILKEIEIAFTADGISVKKILHLTQINAYEDETTDKYDVKKLDYKDYIKDLPETYTKSKTMKKESNDKLKIILTNEDPIHQTPQRLSPLEMRHEDALSRHPVSLILTEMTARLKKAQHDDLKIKLLIKLLEKEPYEDYVLENGILCKVKDGSRLIVVPKRMQNEIIRKYHVKGHFGIIKTEELINRDYYIENSKEKIKSVIDNCVECILISHKKGKKEGYLHPLDKGDTPLSTYHIDHLGPLTSTNKNYKYIFTVVDGFTKFTWIYPTKTLSTDEVLQKLKLQQDTFGSPERIITDRNAAFTSNEFKKYCNDENITHYMITTGQPRGNGQVERVHQIIINALSKLTADDPTKWYRIIGNLQRCLNGTFQRSIGMTPFELLIGTKMRDRNDEILKLIEEEHLEIFEDHRSELREKAKQNIQKIQEENRKVYNRKRKEAIEYEIGDLVAIKRTQFVQGHKLHPKYLGPYQIVQKKRNERYAMKKIGDGEGPINTTSSADLMKPWSNGNYNEESHSSGTDE